MKRIFTASITHEGDWSVAQCLEVDVASQGETAEDALANLGEAPTLHVTPPVATALPDLRLVEVEIGAGQRQEAEGGRPRRLDQGNSNHRACLALSGTDSQRCQAGYCRSWFRLGTSLLKNS